MPKYHLRTELKNYINNHRQDAMPLTPLAVRSASLQCANIVLLQDRNSIATL